MGQARLQDAAIAIEKMLSGQYLFAILSSV